MSIITPTAYQVGLPSFEKLNLKTLKQAAKNLGLKGYSPIQKKDKVKLINKFRAHFKLPLLPVPKVSPPKPASKPSAPKPASKPSAPKPASKPSAPKPASKPSAPKPASKPIAPKPPPGEFKEFEGTYKFKATDLIPDVTVGIEKLTKSKLKKKKSKAADDMDNFAVTPEEFLEELKSATFVTKIMATLQKLYKYKEQKYIQLKEETKKQVAEDKAEMAEMKKEGVGEDSMKGMFPMLKTGAFSIAKYRKLGKLAKAKRLALNVASIRKGLREAISDPKNGIQSITGKTRKMIRDELVGQLYMLSRGFEPFVDSFLNIILTGPAGVGKTKLAGAIGFVYAKSGILLHDGVVVVSPADLVSQYIGGTAGKARGVLSKGLEQVIFLDEAYQIVDCRDGKLGDKGSHGLEAIAEIVNYLDKHVGQSVMIVAGYEKEITDCFLASNSGLNRRFPFRFKLPPYEPEDLANIFIRLAERKLKRHLFAVPALRRYVYTVIYRLNQQSPEIFKAGAGDIVNLVSFFLRSFYVAKPTMTTRNIFDFAVSKFVISKGFLLT